MTDGSGSASGGGGFSAAEALNLSYDDETRGLLILSFDPGVTTGWAFHRLDLEVLVGRGFTEAVWAPGSGWVSGQLVGLSENSTVDAMVGLTRAAFSFGSYGGDTGDLFAIAMEDFVPRMLEQKRSFLSPVRIFSKYEYGLWSLLGARGAALPYFKQSASDAKNVVSDERLSRWNVLKPGQVHARDAQRHGILLARKFASDPSVRRQITEGLVLPSS